MTAVIVFAKSTVSPAAPACLIVHEGHFSPCAPLTCLVMETTAQCSISRISCWLGGPACFRDADNPLFEFGGITAGLLRPTDIQTFLRLWVGGMWCVALLQQLNLKCPGRLIHWKTPTHFNYDWLDIKIKENITFISRITTATLLDCTETLSMTYFYVLTVIQATHICLLVSASPRNYVPAPYNPLFPFRRIDSQLLSFLRVAQVQEMKLPVQIAPTRPL